MKRTLFLASFILAVLMFAGQAPAANFVVNCGLYTQSSAVNINQPADDVIIGCLLDVASVKIVGKSITVDGSIGGEIRTSGTAGQKLFAGVTTGSNPACVSGGIQAQETIKILSGAILEDDNTNGGITLDACGDIDVDQTGGSSLTSGAKIAFKCFGPDCQINVNKATFEGNVFDLDAQGDITIKCSEFTSHGPRDLQRIVSEHGSVLAGTTGASGCTPGQAVFTCPNNCPTPGSPGCELLCQDACTLCQGQACKNKFKGGIESNMFVFAEKLVDLGSACIDIAENITITADDRNPDTTDFENPFTNVIVNLAGAEIRNDFGKGGVISVNAHPPLIGGHNYRPVDAPFNGIPGSDGKISIDSTILVDDGASGGGVNPQAVSILNFGKDFISGNCAGVTPNCNGRAIPDRGFIADPAKRLLHNVQGTPRCDS